MRCFSTQEFTRFLSTGVVTASSHALWRVLSNKVVWVLGHCWVDIPHIHACEWNCFWRSGCVEEVGIYHELDTRYKCGFDSSRNKWTFGSGFLQCQGPRRRREETAWKWKRIKISLTVVMFLLLAESGKKSIRLEVG